MFDTKLKKLQSNFLANKNWTGLVGCNTIIIFPFSRYFADRRQTDRQTDRRENFLGIVSLCTSIMHTNLVYPPASKATGRMQISTKAIAIAIAIGCHSRRVATLEEEWGIWAVYYGAPLLQHLQGRIGVLAQTCSLIGSFQAPQSCFMYMTLGIFVIFYLISSNLNFFNQKNPQKLKKKTKKGKQWSEKSQNRVNQFSLKHCFSDIVSCFWMKNYWKTSLVKKGWKLPKISILTSLRLRAAPRAGWKFTTVELSWI